MDTGLLTIEIMANQIKQVIDNNEPLEYWNKLLVLLTREPAVFFNCLEPRYLGKRRMEKLQIALTYETRGKNNNSVERLVLQQVSRNITGDQKQPVLFSIGYEAMEIDKFVAKIKNNGVKTIVDVREKPISRKKGFAKSALSVALHEFGINYIHLKELGSPEEARKGLRDTKNWAEFTEKYLESLEGQRETLVELSRKVITGAYCLMCFERDHNQCHRSLLAKEIQKLSHVEVVHL